MITVAQTKVDHNLSTVFMKVRSNAGKKRKVFLNLFADTRVEGYSTLRKIQAKVYATLYLI